MRISPLLLLLAAAGCSGPGSEFPRTGTPALKLEVRVLSTKNFEGWSPIQLGEKKLVTKNVWATDMINACPRIELTNDDVASSGVQLDPHTNDWQIVLRLTDAGKAKFLKVTEENIAPFNGVADNRLGFLIDGKVIADPVVQAPISNGICIISNQFSEEEARRIARGVVGP